MVNPHIMLTPTNALISSAVVGTTSSLALLSASAEDIGWSLLLAVQKKHGFQKRLMKCGGCASSPRWWVGPGLSINLCTLIWWSVVDHFLPSSSEMAAWKVKDRLHVA